MRVEISSHGSPAMRYFASGIETAVYGQGTDLLNTRDFDALLNLVADMKSAAGQGHFATVQSGYRQALCQSTEYFGWQQAPRAVSYLSLADFYRQSGDQSGLARVLALLQKMLLR